MVYKLYIKIKKEFETIDLSDKSKKKLLFFFTYNNFSIWHLLFN